jgi:hypothetical protein
MRKISYTEENDWYVITIDNMIFADQTLAANFGFKYEDFVYIITTEYNAKIMFDEFATYVYESKQDIKKAVEWIESLFLARQLYDSEG